MKKLSALLLSLLFACAVLSGCGGEAAVYDTELIGTWVSDYFDTGYIFDDDLTGTDTFFDLTFTYTAADGTIVITYDEEVWGSVEYTYEITDDELTMTRVSSGDDDEPSPYTYTREASSSGDEDETESESEEDTSADESAEDESSAEE